jgi:signal transduction histidine kinase
MLVVVEPLTAPWVAVPIAAAVTLLGVTFFFKFIFKIIEAVELHLVQRNRQLFALNAVGAVLGQSLELEDMVGRTLEKVLEVTDSRAGVVFVLDKDSGRMIACGARGEGHEALLGLGGGTIEEVADSVVLRTPQDAAKAVAEAARDSGLAHFAIVPLKAKGRPVGMMAIASDQQRELGEAEQQWLTSMGAQIGMAIENARLYEEERRRTQEWRSVFEVGEQVAASLDLHALLETVVQRAQELLRTDVAMLTLLSPSREELVIAASVGLRTEALRNLRVPVTETLPEPPIEEGAPVIIEDYLTDPRRTTPPIPEILEEHLVSFIAARFAAKGKLLGVLHVANRTPTHFSEHDAKLLQAFANLAAIAVENARLYERVQSLAVLEERQRIGMDLHDGVIQSIYAVGLNLEECSEEVFNQPSDVRVRLEKAINDLNQVIKDIRNYIFDLRPRALESTNLTDALSTLVRELRVNSLVEANLVVDGGRELGSVLTEDQVTNLFHIAQEALSNVQKHARASSVEARLTTQNGVLRLAISDNGVGFAPGRGTEPGHRGLRNMSERAQSLGGRLSLESAPGKGTSVVIEVPIGSREGNNDG